MLGLIISGHVIEWQALAPLALASLLKKQLGLLCQGQRAKPRTSAPLVLIGAQVKPWHLAKSDRQWISRA